MRLTLKAGVTIDLIVLILFPVLLINFFSPTLSFITSFFEIAPLFWLSAFLEWFRAVVPFVILALFYCALKVSVFKFKGETSRFVTLQAVSALPIFAIWVDRNFIHASGYLVPLLNFVIEVTYLSLVNILYLIFFLMLWKTAKKKNSFFRLNTHFEVFYLWLNLAFFISTALHSINSIDLVYYFRFHMPSELNWLFGYTPTLLISSTCLIGWVLCLKNTKQRIRGWLMHVVLVFVPAVFVASVETFNPLIGYVITSMIVWGSSYEFFRPPVFSLALVLSAVGAFLSFCVMLNAQARIRKRNQIQLSLASTVLAGISLSIVSVLGVLTSLYVLLHAIMSENKQLNANHHNS